MQNERKPKIAVIGLKGLPAFGGAASVGENIVYQLKDDFDFTVYSISTHTSQGGVLNGYTQIIFSQKKVNGFATFKYYLKSLFHSLFLAKYDLIHLHHSESGFITPFLRLKYKVVLTTHGALSNKYDPKFNKITNLFFRFSERINMIFANKIISVSKTDQQYFEVYYKRKCFYIPNGVTPFKIIDTEKEYDILFIAARIYEIKGLHILLEAVRKYNTYSRLLVIGDLNQDKTYQQKIKELSIGLNVEFLDLIKDRTLLSKYILKSKLFVFPSLFEAMSMTLLEIISHKVPVLSSDIESVKCLFSEKEITFFEVNNSDDLAEKLKFCNENQPLIFQKSDNAYNKVMQYYTWDKISINYRNIFNELIET
ncbi:MAG: hypothetical protein B6D44_02135 [Ignavibacteriales bacterium UTCHB2]|jgi:glycosyltransferase involved in cell wall biosynthesis|nr:MAG: hypothetical protein B6D44_02135 [Ignavibacteriales bacterium UTCHB2]